MCLRKKTRLCFIGRYCFIDVLYSALVIKCSNAGIPVNGWDILLLMINFTSVTEADFSLTRCTFLGFSYHSSCSQYYEAVPATAALLPTADIWYHHNLRRRARRPISSYSAVYIKISFNSSCLLLKAVDPQKVCFVSVSLRSSCACLVSTRQQ